MIQLRPYSDIPHRTFVLSSPDERAEADDILDGIDRQIASLPWPERRKLLKRWESDSSPGERRL